jgi:hypothetical protein
MPLAIARGQAPNLTQSLASMGEPLCGTVAVQILHALLHWHLFTGLAMSTGHVPQLIASFSGV